MNGPWFMVNGFNFKDSINHLQLTKNESPDVETPGLLVKALISSYFEKMIRILLMQIYSPVSNRTRNLPTILVVFLRRKHMLIVRYSNLFHQLFNFFSYKIHQLFNISA